MQKVVTGCFLPKMIHTDNAQSGWRILSDKVELFITENGGHMAPVQFDADTDKPIQPYYISPWQNEKLTDLGDPVLVPLRGDFFCMPFGGNVDEVDGEQHSVHGEVSSAKWQLVDESSADGMTILTLELTTMVRKGKVTKKIQLRDGHNAVYTSRNETCGKSAGCTDFGVCDPGRQDRGCGHSEHGLTGGSRTQPAYRRCTGKHQYLYARHGLGQ